MMLRDHRMMKNKVIDQPGAGHKSSPHDKVFPYLGGWLTEEQPWSCAVFLLGKPGRKMNFGCVASATKGACAVISVFTHFPKLQFLNRIVKENYPLQFVFLHDIETVASAQLV